MEIAGLIQTVGVKCQILFSDMANGSEDMNAPKRKPEEENKENNDSVQVQAAGQPCNTDIAGYSHDDDHLWRIPSRKRMKLQLLEEQNQDGANVEDLASDRSDLGQGVDVHLPVQSGEVATVDLLHGHVEGGTAVDHREEDVLLPLGPSLDCLHETEEDEVVITSHIPDDSLSENEHPGAGQPVEDAPLNLRSYRPTMPVADDEGATPRWAEGVHSPAMDQFRKYVQALGELLGLLPSSSVSRREIPPQPPIAERLFDSTGLRYTSVRDLSGNGAMPAPNILATTGFFRRPVCHYPGLVPTPSQNQPQPLRIPIPPPRPVTDLSLIHI